MYLDRWWVEFCIMARVVGGWLEAVNKDFGLAENTLVL
jgi:hypothetical protein